ncbi:MAG TPA: glycosyltransferase [Gemmatimonadales bacterium]|nr:glycosyltransferase [Gemmatimonadales bacterium]
MPETAAVHLSLVLPVLNGADRLKVGLPSIAAWMDRQRERVELLLVDDGSTPATRALLHEFAAHTPNVRVLVNGRNHGKGHAVGRGMIAAAGAFRVFLDADLAYPIEEAAVVLEHLQAGADVAVACRVLPESRYLIAPSFFRYLYTRHLMSRTFNWIVRHTLLPGILDTQAGLKGFTARAATTLFPRLTIETFGFDVELLYVARRHGLRVAQVPVRFRYDSEPSSMRFARDGATMLGDLLKIRWNDWRGRYR